MEDDLRRLKDLRRRLEAGAREAEAIAAEALKLAERFRNRAQVFVFHEARARQRRGERR
jgi:hypothetical protein